MNFPGVPSVYPVPACEERVHQHYHQEDKDGRLVPALHARPEHRLRHLQGDCARTGQKAGLPQQGHIRVLEAQNIIAKVIECIQIISIRSYCCENMVKQGRPMVNHSVPKKILMRQYIRTESLIIS